MRLFRLDIQIVNNKIPKFETISLGKSLEIVFVILQPIPLPANSSFTSIDTGTPQARTKVRMFLAGPINCGITIQAPIPSLATPINISNAGTTQLTINWQTTNATQLINNWCATDEYLTLAQPSNAQLTWAQLMNKQLRRAQLTNTELTKTELMWAVYPHQVLYEKCEIQQ